MDFVHNRLHTDLHVSIYTAMYYQWIDIDPYARANTKQPLSIDAKREKYPAFVAASPRGLVPVCACAMEKAMAWHTYTCTDEHISIDVALLLVGDGFRDTIHTRMHALKHE